MQEGNSECGKRQAVLYDVQGKYNGRTGAGGGGVVRGRSSGEEGGSEEGGVRGGGGQGSRDKAVR